MFKEQNGHIYKNYFIWKDDMYAGIFWYDKEYHSQDAKCVGTPKKGATIEDVKQEIRELIIE